MKQENRPHASKDQVKVVFNRLAPVYEHSVDTNSLYNSEYERPAMMNQVPSSLRNKTVLDAGCAAGWYSEQLLGRGAKVVAIDISPEMVVSAKRRLGDKAKVLCLGLEGSMPFHDHSFDFILSSLTLHYLKSWNRTFEELQRILTPDGSFLFSVHHPISDVALLDHPSYFETELIIDQWKKDCKVFEVPFYRRPLKEIINTTMSYFSIEEIIEPEPTAAFKKESPEGYERLMKRPQFLIINAKNK
ncbi:ubiquinone biosynthesis methyltransferase UbiE [Mesobacillus campisalis]|uniref:Ubiquinone biosynthesis methyltransferase UbiE n=1 Tax=Mesobacillus campisalis TaxID=1408103 RepID=A0A0M2SUS3_9BACI|nr:class I SAM-dependent methyltransferase [Mesobacillus campisalis]KKK36370.1 ubiquinone biosynthesis methyltransferase UbiE [Mesobacillus campisalis]